MAVWRGGVTEARGGGERHARYAYPGGEGLGENGLSTLICSVVDLVLIIPVVRTESLEENLGTEFER